MAESKLQKNNTIMHTTHAVTQVNY